MGTARADEKPRCATLRPDEDLRIGGSSDRASRHRSGHRAGGGRGVWSMGTFLHRRASGADRAIYGWTRRACTGSGRECAGRRARRPVCVGGADVAGGARCLRTPPPVCRGRSGGGDVEPGPAETGPGVEGRRRAVRRRTRRGCGGPGAGRLRCGAGAFASGGSHHPCLDRPCRRKRGVDTSVGGRRLWLLRSGEALDETGSCRASVRGCRHDCRHGPLRSTEVAPYELRW